MNRDPRYRARLNQISSSLETANLNTQASLWSLKESYLGPCLASVSECLEAACYPCIGARRERARARQRRSAATARGRPEFVFDFYNDDWDEYGYGEADEGADVGEHTGLLRGWGTDELDRLLAGSGNSETVADERQPGRAPGMSYGAVRTAEQRRRKSTLLAAQGPDPTILPGSSMFGFLERLPWKIGGRGVKYRPSAADLQENPGRLRRGKKAGHGHMHKDSKDKTGIEHGDEQEAGTAEETSALLEDCSSSDDDNARRQAQKQTHNRKRSHQRQLQMHSKSQSQSQSQGHRRNRSDTTTSRSTDASHTSLSSRGDLFPSEDEAADAVPIDESFALSFAARRSSDGEHDSSNPVTPGAIMEEHSIGTENETVIQQPTPRARHSRPSLVNPRPYKSQTHIQSPLSPQPPRIHSHHLNHNRPHQYQSEMSIHSPLSPLTPPSRSRSGTTASSDNGMARLQSPVGASTSRIHPKHEINDDDEEDYDADENPLTIAMAPVIPLTDFSPVTERQDLDTALASASADVSEAVSTSDPNLVTSRNGSESKATANNDNGSPPRPTNLQPKTETKTET